MQDAQGGSPLQITYTVAPQQYQVQRLKTNEMQLQSMDLVD